MLRCDSARLELKNELSSLKDHEKKMRKFFSYSVSQERKLQDQKERIDEAANYVAEIVNEKPDLRKVLYKKAFAEFEDDEYIERTNRQIEEYLNQDYA